MGAVFTDVALALMAASDITGTPVEATQVKYAQLPAGDRYDATSDAAALLNANPTVLDMDALDLAGSGPNVNYNISVQTMAAATGSEVGIFDAQDRLLILWANQADDVFVKAANTNALISIVYQYTNGVPTGLTVTLQAAAIATPAQETADEADALDTVLSTPKGRWSWWNNAVTAIAIGKLPLAAVGDLIRGTVVNIRLMTPLRTRQLINALVASQPEAQLGTSNDVLMTALRTKEAIEALTPDTGPAHTRVTAAPTPVQIAASSPGDIWTQVA